jgi:hypothetical protein
MRQQLLFVTLVFSLVFALSTAFATTLSEREQIDQEISSLIKGLSATSAMDERFRLLARSEAIIHSTREHTPRQSEEDEIFFDTYSAILRDIPRESHFKKANCGEYATRIRFDFEPGSEPEPTDPAVVAGLKTLSALCG